MQAFIPCTGIVRGFFYFLPMDCVLRLRKVEFCHFFRQHLTLGRVWYIIDVNILINSQVNVDVYAFTLERTIFMKHKKAAALISCIAMAFSLCSCSLPFIGSTEEEEQPDVSELLSQIESLEHDVSSLKAETVPDIKIKNKEDYLNGKNNPAVSEAVAEKEKVMADLPATIIIKDKEYSTELTSLTLSNMDLTDEDIVELKYMVNLTELQIYQNNITDLSPLKGLTELKNLSLFKNKVEDLSPLAGLVGLESLYLRSNNISDISPLDGMVHLRALDLSDNNVSDISPLTNLKQLELLRLNDNNINSITALSGMDKMIGLHLQNNDISDITPLTTMGDLNELYLENNSIGSIEPLMSLTSLQWLKISNNPITNIRPAASLIMLKKLYMQGLDIPAEDIDYLAEQLPDCTFVC